MALASSPSEQPTDPADRVVQLREQVEAMTADRITPAVADFLNKTNEAVANTASAVREQARVVAELVRERPLVAMATAAAMGWIIARISR